MDSKSEFIDDSSASAMELHEAVAGGSVVPSGWFTYHQAEGRWSWSDELARMYGYEPGDVVPTAELLLSHKHPDDAARSETDLSRIVQARNEIAVLYRMIDRHGDEHVIVAHLETLRDANGGAVGTHGRCVDATALSRADVDGAIECFRQHAARIEQVKGFIMAACGVDEDAAFAILKWCSQTHNVKLWRVADRIATMLRSMSVDPEFRWGPAVVERLLLEACGARTGDS